MLLFNTKFGGKIYINFFEKMIIKIILIMRKMKKIKILLKKWKKVLKIKI